MKKLIYVEIAVFFAAGLAMELAHSETVSFTSAWSQINKTSAAQETSRLQTESLTESQTRASRHWLPKIYFEAKGTQTNDSGASFFGLLEQRSLKQTDFNPDSINHPESHLYTRGALGVDLALYEGGMKSSQVDLLAHTVAAQKNVTSQIQLEQYSAVGLAYGSIAVLDQQKTRFQILNAEVSRLIKGYQLGSQSNPVGYSGLLGMKSLINRVNGLLSQYEAQRRSHYATLHELGLKDAQWSPENIDSMAFVDRYFSGSSLSSGSPQQGEALSSYKIESEKESVKASEEIANLEKAKLLPRLGAFAEASMFSGNRETAHGYNAGLYLQWSLYDPSTHGIVKEAKLKSMAAAKYAEASEQEERAGRSALNESFKALRENIDLLNDSQKLLIEQSKMTETLFKNGSINALQFVEILNRRADLIALQGEVNLGLIKVGTQLVTKQKFDIEIHMGSGEINKRSEK
jgi:hypothetical protein